LVGPMGLWVGWLGPAAASSRFAVASPMAAAALTPALSRREREKRKRPS
jgi:hypothetical protein